MSHHSSISAARRMTVTTEMKSLADAVGIDAEAVRTLWEALHSTYVEAACYTSVEEFALKCDYLAFSSWQELQWASPYL